MIVFTLVMLFVIFQRLTELKISSRNEILLKKMGGVEFGSNHYKFIVLMHALFFISMISEYFIRDSYGKLSDLSHFFLVIFAVLQAGRVWVIVSLGKFWNTKIIRVPGTELVIAGPYRYIKHPNYVIVACEIFTLPAIFGLWYTAIIFSVLNALMMIVRIKEENKALEL